MKSPVFIIPQAASRDPSTRNRNISNPSASQAFGVVDSDGNPPEESLHYRGGRNLTDAKALQKRFQEAPEFGKLAGRWYYAGIFYPHFGHFLTESIHRLRDFIESTAEYDGIIFLKSPFQGTFDYDPLALPYVRFFLEDYFGLQISKVVFTTSFLEVDFCDIGRQDSQLGLCPDSGYLRYLRGIEEKFSSKFDWTENRNKEIFLSRQNYLRSGRMLGMTAVEKLFFERGVQIICPETQSIVDQIRTFREAKRVYCEAGSAIHMLDALGPQELDLVIFSRRGFDANYWKNLYKGRVKGVRVFDVVLPIHAYTRTRAGEGHSLAHPKKLFEFLKHLGVDAVEKDFVDDLVECSEADLSSLNLRFWRD